MLDDISFTNVYVTARAYRAPELFLGNLDYGFEIVIFLPSY